MADLSILGYPSSTRYPFIAAQILFNQGPSNAPAGKRKILVVGPQTSAATWAVNTIYRGTDEKTVRDGAGAGSPNHQAQRMIGKVNKTADVYHLTYAATSGGTPASADMTITVAFGSGSNPTATGKLTLELGPEDVDIGFTTSDTATTIGDNIEAAINQRDYLGYTASNSAGVVTLTAKLAGVSQGDGTTGVHRVGGSVDAGKNVTLTLEAAALGLSTGTDGADGTTTELANLTAALATVTNRDDYYIVTSVWNAAQLAPLKTHISSRAEPNPGKLGCVIAGNTGALAACQTIATGINFNRVGIIWQKNSRHTPVELAAAYTAILQKYEEGDPTVNLNGYAGADWPIVPQKSNADWPSGTDLEDAVTDGICPVEVLNSARTSLGMSVTTQSKDSSGALDDWRSTERHRVSGADNLLTKIKTRYALTYGRKKLAPDQLDADGKVNPSQKLRNGVVTPSMVKPFILKVIREDFENSNLRDMETPTDSMILQIDPSNGSRLQCAFSFVVIDHLNQTSFRAAEVNAG